jgi:hypothetical protein
MVLRLLAVLLVLPACARAAPGESSRPPLMLELRAARDEPAASLSYDGRTVTAPPATYCWGQRCVDAFGFPPPADGITVPEGVTIQLVGDATAADVSVAEPPGEGETGPQPPGETVQELRLQPGSDALDVPPGEYWLVVFAQWDTDPSVVGGAGDATFAFAIRVR